MLETVLAICCPGIIINSSFISKSVPAGTWSHYPKHKEQEGKERKGKVVSMTDEWGRRVSFFWGSPELEMSASFRRSRSSTSWGTPMPSSSPLTSSSASLHQHRCPPGASSVTVCLFCPEFFQDELSSPSSGTSPSR